MTTFVVSYNFLLFHCIMWTGIDDRGLTYHNCILLEPIKANSTYKARISILGRR